MLDEGLWDNYSSTSTSEVEMGTCDLCGARVQKRYLHEGLCSLCMEGINED